MFKKDTEKLLAEIKGDSDMKKFLTRNQKELVKPFHIFLEELLQEKNLNKADVIKNSLINTNYAYHIFSGKKDNPSRDKIISLAIAMNLNLDETQYLLRYAGEGSLYPRNSRDALIISAIEQGLTVTVTNLLLTEFNESVLN